MPLPSQPDNAPAAATVPTPAPPPEQLHAQNRADASQFSSTFGGAYQDAETKAALDFGDQFSDPKTQAPSQPAPIKNNDTGLIGAAGEAAVGAGRDIGLGMIEAPREIARGVRGAFQNVMNIGNELDKYFNTPTIQILNEKGQFDPAIIGTADAEAKGEKSVALPEIDKPKTETVTGDIIEGVSQFLTGFKGVGAAVEGNALLSGGQEALQALGKGGEYAVNLIKGTAADLGAFDGQQARLSNVIQQVPALQNPVTEFLQAKPDDSFAESKLKQAIEGALGTGIGEALFSGVKLLKTGLAAKGEAEAAAASPETILQENGQGSTPAAAPSDQAPGVTPDQFNFLGDATRDDLIIPKDGSPAPTAAAAEAAGATDADAAAAAGSTAEGDAAAKIATGANETANITPQNLDVTQTAANAAANEVESQKTYQINFARIEGPDDIKNLADQMVNHPDLAPGIDAARRGKISNEQTLTSAQDIDGFNSILARRVGDPPSAEQVVAYRQIYYDTTDKLMQAAKAAAGANAGSIDQFNFRKMLAIHAAVQKEFMGARAESGRTLQAWSIPLGGGGPQNLAALEQTLTDFGGAGASKDLASRIASMGDSLNTDQLNAIVNGSALARTQKAVTEAWQMGLLTNPETHVKRLASHVLTGLMLGMERFAQAGFDGSPVTLREGAEFWTGMMESQKLALKNAAQAFRTGETGQYAGDVDAPHVSATSQEILDPDGKMGIFSQALSGYGAILRKYAGGAIASVDEWNKTILKQAQARALATREGIAQGLEGDALTAHISDTLADLPDNINAASTQFAQYGSFTKDLGPAGQAYQNLLNKAPALRFITPFVRVPANIFKFTFERTPLALLSQNVRDAINAGGASRAEAMTRIGMGTSLLAMSADMAQNGLITGAGPTDPNTRAALRRTGWQPYSVKIGDTYHQYGALEPMATLLGFGADMSEILSNYESYDIQSHAPAQELATAAAIALGNQVVGKTFLEGFANLNEALSDPGRFGEAYVQKFAASFVPSGVGAVTRALDPTEKQVFNMADAIKAKLPGFSEDVPPRRNIWGEPIKYFYPNNDNIASSTAERVLSMFNPVYYSAEKPGTGVDQWMLHNGFNIDMPDKTQAFNDNTGFGSGQGVKIDLHDYPKIYDRLVELRGNALPLQKYGNQGMKDFFSNLANEKDPYGRHLGFFLQMGNSFDDQQKFISGVTRDYETAAKQQLIKEFPVISDKIAQGRKDAALLSAVRPSLKQQPELVK